MKTFHSPALVAAIVLALGGWPGAIGQIRQVNVQGRIIGSPGGPLKGDVTVIESGSNVTVSSYQADSQGRFSFPANVGQLITVVAKADGYISLEKELTVGLAASQLEFVLLLSGQVAGRVIDEVGKPVPGAVVRVRYPGRRRVHELSQEIGEVATDDYGYFTLPFVERRTPFVLDVAAPDRPVKSSLPMTLPGESMTGVLIAVSGKSQLVRGRVLDSAGQPVSGASVHLRWIDKDQNPGRAADRSNSLTLMLQENRFVTTTVDGSFQFQGVPEGDVIVVARYGSYRPSVIERSMTAGTPLDVILILR